MVHGPSCLCCGQCPDRPLLLVPVQNAAGRAAIKGVSLRGTGSSSWRELSNDWGARWETSSQPGFAPFDMQVSQDDGQVVSHILPGFMLRGRRSMLSVACCSACTHLLCLER